MAYRATGTSGLNSLVAKGGPPSPPYHRLGLYWKRCLFVPCVQRQNLKKKTISTSCEIARVSLGVKWQSRDRLLDSDYMGKTVLMHAAGVGSSASFDAVLKAIGAHFSADEVRDEKTIKYCYVLSRFNRSQVDQRPAYYMCTGAFCWHIIPNSSLTVLSVKPKTTTERERYSRRDRLQVVEKRSPQSDKTTVTSI